MKIPLATICIACLASASATAEDMKLNDVKRLFPSYLSALSANEKNVMTGAEYEIFQQLGDMAKAESLKDESTLKGPVWNRSQIRDLMKNYLNISEPEAHKKQLQNELKDIASSFSTKAFECKYEGLDSTFKDYGRVSCSGGTSDKDEGCSRKFELSIYVTPQTKQFAQEFYNMGIVYPAYYLEKECPG